MTQSPRNYPVADDIDVAALGRALWRAKGWVLTLALGVGILTFVCLAMVRPLYTSETRILIQSEESAFTRPTSEQRDQLPTLDEQAVQSQVQVLTSRDLAVEVVNALDLTNNAEFAKDAGTSLFRQMLNRIGLGRGTPQSEQEKAANAFAEHLAVYQLSKSSVIAIEYTSGDPSLAAEIANKLADVYIQWQRKAKLEQTKDATAWLSAQIEALRKKVAESEEAVEQFRSKAGLFAGTNNVTLNAQQLSELNSQVILAEAQKSEAEARARLIKKMLADKGDIDATPEVLKSELVARLIDQRVQVQRQLAELSATLLPSHPRIQQLSSELADVRKQIRDEAAKIAKSLENEAQIAAAREASLRKSLNTAKTETSGLSDSEVKLRALEREAKANRDLLESYLARYRDASSRHDVGAVPADATIVSRAHASILPSFPKKGPITLLATVATALLALSFVLARELIAGASTSGVVAPPVPVASRHTRRPRHTPAAPAAASAEEQRVARPQAPPRSTPVERPPVAPPANAAPVSRASRAERPPARPSWLNVEETRRPETATSHTPLVPKAELPEAAASSEPATAAGLIERLRRSMPGTQSEGESSDQPIRRAPRTADASSSQPNDLRHYLQHMASAPHEVGHDARPDAGAHPTKMEKGKVGAVLKSLNAVLNHILAAGKGEAPAALLVTPATEKVDATSEAIEIARALVAKRLRVVLVDLTRGAAAVSGRLGIPRVPGFNDLAAGRVSFEDVLAVDEETPLQVIAAGNPKITANGDEGARFARVFSALTQAYDCVVLHADRETALKLKPELRFELPVLVVVLPAGASAEREHESLAEFAGFGCPVVAYEQSGKEPRSGLFGRVAAV